MPGGERGVLPEFGFWKSLMELMKAAAHGAAAGAVEGAGKVHAAKTFRKKTGGRSKGMEDPSIGER